MLLDKGRVIILRDVGGRALFSILIVGSEDGRFGLGRAGAGGGICELRGLGEEGGELRSKCKRRGGRDFFGSGFWAWDSVNGGFRDHLVEV